MAQQVVYRTREMQRLEARMGKPMDRILTELYIEQGLTMEQLASVLGITKGSASRWLERFGIEARGHGWRRLSAVSPVEAA